MLFHDQLCAKKEHNAQAKICADGVQKSCMAARMVESVNLELKRLRKSAVPALSIRAMADALGIGHSRYAYFEDPRRFKKRELPLDLARRIAAVLANYGIDPADVMKLAGLNEDELQPESRLINASRPAVRYVPLQVALPSEAALYDMFYALLTLVPEDSTKAETARMLAEKLHVGFSGIGPYQPELSPVQVQADEIIHQADLRDRSYSSLS